MRLRLLTRSAGRQSRGQAHAPHCGMSPDRGPGNHFPEPFLLLSPTVCMSQRLPSPSPGMRTPFSKWVQSRVPRSPCSPAESRAKCGPPGRGAPLLPHGPATRCWHIFYYLLPCSVGNGISLSFEVPLDMDSELHSDI